MKYFIGIDGGGTKTDYLLCDEMGKTLYRCNTGPCRNSNNLIIEELFTTGIKALYNGAGVKTSNISTVCFGIPGYGEHAVEDALVAAQIAACFNNIPCKIVNDVEAGWAGALALASGINVVSGTGSISFGKDDSGNTARCGGWWSNEGSGWWLGSRTMEIFLKQLDQRMDKTLLYDILWNEFDLKDKSDIFNYSSKNLVNNRKNIAAVQLMLDKAAEAGDSVALNVYKEAAIELALLVKGCYKQLDFKNSAKVSFTGSVFKAGGKLLDPFTKELGGENFSIMPPQLEPVQGAVLLGIEAVDCKDWLESVRDGMLSHK